MIRFRDSSLNIQYLFFGQEQKSIVFNDMKYYFRMRMSERVRLESLFILKKARYKFLIFSSSSSSRSPRSQMSRPVAWMKAAVARRPSRLQKSFSWTVVVVGQYL